MTIGILNPTCYEANEILSKAGAKVILRTLLNLHIELDSIPEGPEYNLPVSNDTVVPVGAPVPTSDPDNINASFKNDYCMKPSG